MPVYHFRCFAIKAVKWWHHQNVKKCTWDLQPDTFLILVFQNEKVICKPGTSQDQLSRIYNVKGGWEVKLRHRRLLQQFLAYAAWFQFWICKNGFPLPFSAFIGMVSLYWLIFWKVLLFEICYILFKYIAIYFNPGKHLIFIIWQVLKLTQWTIF